MTATAARELGAAEMALMRCRELAGVRIKHRCEECANGTPLHLVASANPTLLTDAPRLVQGGTDFFQAWLTENGFQTLQASALCQQLETYAARTLAEQRCPELPSGFIAAIERAKEVESALDS